MFGAEGGKFLGFMLTYRGIEVNLDKCATILSMRNPTSLKDVQSLVGRLTSLSCFFPKLAEKIKPIVKTVKKGDRFKWDDECEEAFEVVKAAMSSMPILEKPAPGSRLLLYISVSNNAITSALV